MIYPYVTQAHDGVTENWEYDCGGKVEVIERQWTCTDWKRSHEKCLSVGVVCTKCRRGLHEDGEVAGAVTLGISTIKCFGKCIVLTFGTCGTGCPSGLTRVARGVFII